tara:strand:- start:20266 stop:20724 length:459 start_codon:yes stop_codon:yes gene_type:complete
MYSVGYDVDKTYTWDVSDGVIINETDNQITVQWPDSLGTYVITVSTIRHGCYGDTSTYTVTVEDCPRIDLFFPNAFTPNMDNHNSYYTIYGSDVGDISYMVIFDRWGDKIFETNGNGRWDGTYEGEKCQIGVYVVNIMYRDIRFIREIHLIR